MDGLRYRMKESLLSLGDSVVIKDQIGIPGVPWFSNQKSLTCFCKFYVWTNHRCYMYCDTPVYVLVISRICKHLYITWDYIVHSVYFTEFKTWGSILSSLYLSRVVLQVSPGFEFTDTLGTSIVSTLFGLNLDHFLFISPHLRHVLSLTSEKVSVGGKLSWLDLYQ